MDRIAYAKAVMERTGKVENKYIQQTSIKELSNGYPFKIEQKTGYINMDYDMKRKPILESMEEVSYRINFDEYKVVNFKTVPFETIDEYKKYKKEKDNTTVLKTLGDWQRFFSKITEREKKQTVIDCIKGDAMGYWRIPAYHKNKGADRIAWINQFCDGFVVDDDQIKNARKKARCKKMLGYKSVEDMMNALGDMLKNMGAEINYDTLVEMEV